MTPENQDTLTVGLTPWYIRRMSILFLMFTGFAGWFAYDWQIGYPKKALVYEEYLAFKAKGEEGMREWARVATERKIGFEDEKSMAPFHADAGKIQEQFFAMSVCATVGGVVLAMLLRSLGTSLGVAGGRLLLPHAGPVEISAIRKVDTRKWMTKGLAYIWYEQGGTTRKGVIDGMKYGGFKGEKPHLPDRILEHVVGSFHGELVELQGEEPEPEKEETA